MKKGDIKEFITSDGKSITISVPITDYSTPEDIRGETLSLLRSCIAEIEKSPTFRDWYDSRRDESIDYLTNEEERGRLLSGKDKAAGIYYVLVLALEASSQTPEADFDASLYYFARGTTKMVEEYLSALEGKDATEVKIKEAEVFTTFKEPRELTKLMTRPRKRGETLFDLIDNEESLEQVQQYIEEGRLFSASTPGLAADAIEIKVIMALQKHLYAQSKGYGGEEAEGIPDSVLREYFGDDYDKKREGLQSSSFVCIDPDKFPKEVLGRDNIGGEDRKRVMAALRHLDGKFYYDDKEQGFKRLLTIERIPKNTRKIFIACRQVFRDGIKNNFINAKTDELERLSGITSAISLRLYNLLKELDSYNTPTQKKGEGVSINTAKLMERIAVKTSYDKNPKRREKDFLSAVEDMKRVGIITKAVTQGENTKFYISPDWRKSDSGETEIASEK